MVKISITNSNLQIEDSTKEVFNWRHRTFFNISLGFEYEPAGLYRFSELNEFQNIIKETTTYLTEEGLAYSFDDQVGIYIKNIQDQEIEFTATKDSLLDRQPFLKPQSFVRPLKPYQEKGFEHFVNIRHGANFSVPGSGKTTMVYSYFAKLREEGAVDKIFVVGPFSSFSPWEQEAVECFGRKLNSVRLVGPKRQPYYLLSKDTELFLCHYQTASNDKDAIIELCKRFKILLVIDESHYIKRFSGGFWSDSLLSIAPYAAIRVVLSGTPMPNGYIDLWSQMTFLWPGKQLLGEKNTYKTRCENAEEQEQIKREIRPYFYRVKKIDLNLPKPKFNIVNFPLKPIQSQIYHALSVKLITELKLQPTDRQKLKQWRKAKMIRLLQAATNPTLLNRDSKEFEVPPLSADGTPLVELIEKYSQFEVPAKFEAALLLTRKLLKEGKKVIIWTSFIHNIEMLEISLKDVNSYSIHGAIPRDDKEDENFNREKSIDEFKKTSVPSVLIANPAACAESISLHRVCHDAIYLDRTFNCGQYIQSLDRIHRIGLEKHELVTYHILLAENTIDQTINSRLEEKKQTMIRVLEEELPIGAFDIEGPEMEKTDIELEADFQATVKDARTFLGNQKK